MKRYFDGYATALKNQQFERLYIDAFAGSGERQDSRPAGNSLPLFEEDAEEFSKSKEGSARIALRIEPPFHRYIFIERSSLHMAGLTALRSEFPYRNIELRQGDANNELLLICKSVNWRSTRAAVFLDPYGMELRWSTLNELAATEAVDIALLFPTGPLNRMLTKNGIIPEEWQSRIDDHLGPCGWRDACYAQQTSIDLFGYAAPASKLLNVQGLENFVQERLKGLFPHVCEQTLSLENSKGSVLYHLFIICANPSKKAGEIAMRIARSAIRPRHKKHKNNGLL
ncbi:three-Cys-motif partner protein TcmP [Methylocapsa polymorpha]|uniref:Three-Cys-motif partner protein TcmP n=1 Tax=Methylocapsa polymorpha TaxID=3080828 RepID=A0ABZ0HUH2_9HYPH|nr:three-Cys-motif partner protein TcmP [Methylocapsa sp. RX1]